MRLELNVTVSHYIFVRAAVLDKGAGKMTHKQAVVCGRIIAQDGFPERAAASEFADRFDGPEELVEAMLEGFRGQNPKVVYSDPATMEAMDRQMRG